jgi:hypothetical protein
MEKMEAGIDPIPVPLRATREAAMAAFAKSWRRA